MDSYNFASDNKAEIQIKNKTIINSSVLGLIFEKLNGYQEGSYYTPGYVTMYMCRENIRKTVIQKFKSENEFKSIESLTDLFNNLDKISIKRANEIFNSIKICDPAVGSGHFLVSALNELIAIKSELKILADKEGKKLRDVEIEVINDELYLTINDEIFAYNYKNKSNQNIQETIFHEKQILIENCLFGVDINPKSVNICRLRLWIELLKNAYYTKESNYNDLETLPNIDINIKCGNSLISHFAINGNGNNGSGQSLKTFTKKYKEVVAQYKNTTDRNAKRTLERFITEQKENFARTVNPNDDDLKKIRKIESEIGTMPIFFNKDEQTKWQMKLKLLENEKQELQKQYNDKLKSIYSNSFEWRFEFPEVLDDNGYFIGFDLIIGNPPYISGRDWGERKNHFKAYYNQKYEVAEYQLDLYILFIELGKYLLKNSSYISFIIPNTWLANHKTEKIRNFFLNDLSLHEIVFTHDKVFDEANVDVVIFQAKKMKENYQTEIKEIKEKEFIFLRKLDFYQFSKNDKKVFDIYSNPIYKEIINRIENNSKPISEYFYINRGIHPYRTDGYGKSKFSKGFQTKEDYDQRSYHSNTKINKTFRPELKGKHIFPYYHTESDEYVSYGDWLAEPREEKYFKGNRIYLRKILGKNGLIATLINENENYIADQSLYIAIPKSKETCLEYIIALLNSKLIGYYFRIKYNEFDALFPQIKVTEFKNIPIIFPDNKTKNNIKCIVNEIMELKVKDNNFDTTKLENSIDSIIYKIYKIKKSDIELINK